MKILLFSFMMTSMAWGQVSTVNIQNFNFSYSAPRGEGTADTFSYAKNVNQAQNVQVEKVGDDFNILLEGVENQELVFKDAPDLVRNASDITLRGFNLSLASSLSLTINSGVFESSDKNVDLSNLNLSCNRVNGPVELKDQMINGCIQKMSFRAGAFSTDGEGLEQAVVKAIDESHNEILSAVGIKNLNFKVTNGKFELSADIRAQISGSAKGSGTVKYDAAAKLITVKVSSVKFSILDVTSKVFDELEKNESETFKVKEPYLYITIK